MGKSKYNILLSDDQLVKLNKAQEGTVQDLKNMLRSHRIALMVRPTGFGKTFTLIKLCNKEKYKHVIYMYPTTVIKQSIEDDYHNPDSSNGILYAATIEEAKEHKGLPYIEFVSYKKMLIDWNKFETKNISENTSEEDRENARREWIRERFADVDLLVLDEAHMTGANGFMKYWRYIHELTTDTTRGSRLHILGATATPLRTNPAVDIERDIFYYTWGGERRSARIKDFTFGDCWRLGILLTPYYTKGIIDKEEQLDYLENKLHKLIVGCESWVDPTVVVKRGRKGKSSSVRLINDPRIAYTIQNYNQEVAKLRLAINEVPDPKDLVRNAVTEVVPDRVQCGKYMRFLAFYQNTSDMIKFHDKINQAFIDAFNIGGKDSVFTKLNTSYVLSPDEKLDDASIPRSGVNIITKRDEELKKNPSLCVGNIDIIHSINMLNMGYHVGHVTGVVIKRSTKSEIIYYQQIGRCMSIKAKTNPIIIDFANADAELFSGTHDTVREEAAATIREFIETCNTSEDYDTTNAVYKLVNMNISDGIISDDLLEYLYCDRKAPIYFIKGVADALNCSEGVEEIILRLHRILLDKGYEPIVPDIGLENEPRLSKFITGSITYPGILNEEIVAFNKNNLQGGDKDA